MEKLIIKKKKKANRYHNKSLVCSVNVLDLSLWCPILALVLSVLGFVGKGASPLVRKLGVGESWRIFFSAFLGLMGHLLQLGALKLSHQMSGL
jgi:hypothetical protein